MDPQLSPWGWGSGLAARRDCGDLLRFHRLLCSPVSPMVQSGVSGEAEILRGLSKHGLGRVITALHCSGTAPGMAEGGQKAHLNPQTSLSVWCLHIQLLSGKRTTQRGDNSVSTCWSTAHTLQAAGRRADIPARHNHPLFP